MKFKLLLAAFLITAFSWGQSSIATIGTSYTQDFNSLASSGSGNTWTNNTTLPGWYAKTSGGSGTNIITYDTTTGTTTTGALYSFGVAGTNAVTERGFGMVVSNAFAGTADGVRSGFYGWRLRNNTGATITSLTVTWTGEQWRKAANAASHNLRLFYQTGTTVTDLTAGTWTTASSTFTGPLFDAAAATAVDGNLASNRTAGITATITVTIAAGDEIMLRWADLNDNNNEHVMCIDDVTVVANNANKVSAANGDWNTAATWTPVGVPTAADNVLILAAHTVYTATSLTRTGTTTVNGGFQVNGGGYASGTPFVYAATGSSLIMNNGVGLYGISTGQVFWPTVSPPFNVTIQGSGAQINNPVGSVAGTLTVNSQLDCAVANALTITTTGTAVVNAALNITTAGGFTVNGILQMNAGSFINNNSPIYGNASTLRYNVGAVYGRGYEWLALGVGTIGTTAGYPNNVTLSNNTNLNYTNGTPLAKAMYGNLTVDAGSTFSMDYASVTAGGILTVRGDVNVAGTLRLGFATGDDLYVTGNLSFTGTGSLVGNNRAIYFNKNGTQTISSVAALTIPYLRTAGSTATTVQLLSDLIVSSSAGGVNVITFANAADVFDLNGRTLTIGSTGNPGAVSGAGTFKGSTTSNLTLLGTGSVGTLNFATDLNLATFTMNRTASATGCVMGTALTINTALVLTNGLIDLNGAIMTLASTCSNTFTATANSYVISDVSATGSSLRKIITATATTYNFPIGSGGTQYSPATINFAGATIAGGAYIGMAVENTKHPNLDATLNYLNRYWSVTSSGITVTSNYNFTGTHITGEMIGPSTKFSNQWNGTAWLNNGISATGLSPFAVTVSTATTLPATNHFTAGLRDREINVVQVSTTYLTGSTYDFGAVTIGSPLAIPFTIQNTGQLTIALTNPAPTMTGNPPFTTGNYSGTPVTGATSAGPGIRTFTITFNPTSAGTFTGSATIINNDADENPYVINFTGEAICVATNTITPTSGPVGTEVTITATTNNLTAASVTFLGVAAASVTYIDATTIKAIVPSGAPNGSGVVTTTNATGCQVSNPFTVDKNLTTTCQGGSAPTELFISEVTDSTYGGLTYVEIYNGTGASVNLATYSLEFFANGSATSYAVQALSGTIANGATYTVATALSGFSCGVAGGNGSLANLTSTASGINFADAGNVTIGHDHIALIKSAVKIDSWGTYTNQSWATALGLGDRGADFRRKNNVTVPNPTFSTSDWDIIEWSGTGLSSCSTNDYSNIGSFNFLAGTPPTVTLHPAYSPTCKATSLTVAGTEGFSGGNPLAYQWYAVAPNVATWTALTDAGLYTGATTATLSISDVSSLVGYQFYCQIRENTSTCYSASNAVMITAVPSTTWNGTAWSSAAPNLNTVAVINGNYDMVAPTSQPSFEACSLTINSPATVTIDGGKYIAIENDLTVNVGGSLIVQNNGSLVMIDDDGIVTNNGTTQVTRTTAPFELYDYTYWSSPVDATNIATTFAGWRMDYSFEFNTANFSDTNTVDYYGNVTAAGVPDSFDDFAPWAWLPYTGAMTNGKGYAIMGPTSLPFSPSATTSVTFSGKVNNGVITPSVVESSNAVNTADDFNLIGNPYPSAIWANKFITDNGAKTSGSLYFWTHVENVSVSNPGPYIYNFISDDYAVYNLTGGTRASLTTPPSAVPTGYIGTGQGFFVEAQGNNTLTFNNSMRDKTYANTQFFRSAQPEAQNDRIWLNLRNADGMFGQLLVGYFSDTTLDFDWAYDARVNQSNNYLSFYTLAANEKYKIQARPAFEDSDIVPIGYFSAVAGEFNISIDNKEGILDAEETNIYIEDLELNIIHDLKASPYTFTTEIGKFENRFLLRYTDGSALNNPDFDTLNNSVVVASNNGQLTIKSYIQTLEEVTVYDILGRQLFNQKGIGANDFSTTNISLSQQSVIVKIKLESGTIVTKKVLL